MRQYNNGSYFLTKYRSFSTPQSNNKSVERQQNNSYAATSTSSSSYDSTLNAKVYDVVDLMPSFPGGQSALMQWLGANIRYPVLPAEHGIQGRVIVQFVVEKDGSVSGVTVAQSVDPLLDKEALRFVKSMPKWIPSKNNGSAVRVKYNVPVTFKLS